MSRASERYRQQKYAPWLLGGLLLIQLVLMAYTSRTVSEDGTEQSILRTWMMTLVSPVESLFGGATSGAGSFWNDYIALRGARERNTVLESENARLRAEIENARAAAAENERLRRILELQPLLKYDSVVAEVIARETNVWFKRIVVSKGTTSGIQLNHPVVTPDGLVGRVVAVGPNFAQIQLITDEHAGVGGRLLTSRVAGELKGRGDGTGRFKSVSGLLDVPIGEAIVTSGLDQIYPAGILIGNVEAVAPGAGASPLDITVRPAANLDNLEEVMVLIVPPQDLKVTETLK